MLKPPENGGFLFFFGEDRTLTNWDRHGKMLLSKDALTSKA